MAKKDDNSFASSAGLMRYFDTEDDKGIRVGPKVVIGIAIGFAALVLLLNYFVPMN
ncbi:MAG: preprotein translocase subunit Sec61beta [Candidatus Methanomethylophilaceae archaeon]|jgi:preprotein translocase subunit Sec61beta